MPTETCRPPYPADQLSLSGEKKLRCDKLNVKKAHQTYTKSSGPFASTACARLLPRLLPDSSHSLYVRRSPGHSRCTSCDLRLLDAFASPKAPHGTSAGEPPEAPKQTRCACSLQGANGHLPSTHPPGLKCRALCTIASSCSSGSLC